MTTLPVDMAVTLEGKETSALIKPEIKNKLYISDKLMGNVLIIFFLKVKLQLVPHLTLVFPDGCETRLVSAKLTVASVC